MEGDEEEKKTRRIYVGGLGDRVTQQDITNTFSNLGVVQSVDVVRTKGRSFAYFNFFPTSDNSLAKLFSTYNGCSWKGGKLKLEKAKEHYTDRLKREWAEQAELENSKHTNHGDADVSIVDSSEPTLDLKDMEFRLFFPKLRKVRPLPLSGTGKHKYSFRRLEGPPRPVHICDCPEHWVPVETRTVSHASESGTRKAGIKKEEYNMLNSVMSRFTGRGKDPREAKIHDSLIQDDGINEEEINMMDSVMKKLLDKATSSKNDHKNRDTSLKKTVPTPEILTDDIDDGADDDDIKINSMAVQNFSSYSSRSLERQTSLPDVESSSDELHDDDDDDDDDDIQINAVGGRNKRRTSLANEMAKLNERRNPEDLAHQSKPGLLDQNIESSNMKRKSVSTEANGNDLAYPIHEMASHSKIQLKKSDPDLEPEHKKATTNGVWSQKSAWKQLVGDGISSSFTLSQITLRDDANHEERPKLGDKQSSKIKKRKMIQKPAPESLTDSDEVDQANNLEQVDSESSRRTKKGKKVHAVAPEEPKHSVEMSTSSKEDDQDDTLVQIDGESSQHNKKGKKVCNVAYEEPKPTVETSMGSKKNKVNNSVQIDQLAQHDEEDTPKLGKKSKKVRKVAFETPTDSKKDDEVNIVVQTGQTVPHDEKHGSREEGRGSSWLQKSSWTQLVGGSNGNSFSISQILPGDVLQKQNSGKPDNISTFGAVSTGAFWEGQRTNEFGFDGSNSTVKRNPQEPSFPRQDVEVSKAASEPMKTSPLSQRGVEISENCPFMRNADSVKEWTTAKTAVSKSLKKMKNK